MLDFISKNLNLLKLEETPEYLQKKLEDHRYFCGIIFSLFAFIGPLLWIWDYIIDPVGAKNTIELRLLYFIFLPAFFVFKYIKNYTLLAVISIGAILLFEMNYIEILNRLNTGMSYGIAGFMYYMFLPLVALQGFSLYTNLIYTFLAAAVPHLMAFVGFAHGFQHSHYAVLIWPAAALIMIIQFFYAKNYKQRYELEKALEHMSNTDPMTGVSNRRYFIPRLNKEVMRAHRFKHNLSLLMIDIDFFKKINDNFGHPTGDLVICKLADICKNEIRQIDVLARIGGEEFAVLLLETTMNNALIVAERIRNVAENTIIQSLDNREVHFTISIGVAEQVTDRPLEEELIHMADSALYLSKSSGRNCVVGKNPTAEMAIAD